LNFYYPEISFHEIQKHKLLVLKKSGMSEKQFNNIFDILLDNVILVSEEQFAECLDEANDLMGKIDIDDVVFLACAIALETDIWTDDGDFQKQKKVKVLKTKDFVKRFLRV
jgi:predicted nucleic acid-binding protein